MAIYGSNYDYGESVYKDEGSAEIVVDNGVLLIPVSAATTLALCSGTTSDGYSGITAFDFAKTAEHEDRIDI
jgi:hypothetical protein